jgi:hypothetical protein
MGGVKDEIKTARLQPKGRRALCVYLSHTLSFSLRNAKCRFVAQMGKPDVTHTCGCDWWGILFSLCSSSHPQTVMTCMAGRMGEGRGKSGKMGQRNGGVLGWGVIDR